MYIVEDAIFAYQFLWVADENKCPNHLSATLPLPRIFVFRTLNFEIIWARQFSERKISGGSSSVNNQRNGSYFYSFFDWYSKKLDTHPILTKCISAGLVSSVGNVLAQVITYRQEQQLQADVNNISQSQQQPFEIPLRSIKCHFRSPCSSSLVPVY